MAGHHHPTFIIKREREFSPPGCAFSHQQQQFPTLSSPPPPVVSVGTEKTADGLDIDMDLAKFLGQPDLVATPNDLEPSEWNSLFTGTELEGLDFLDPTTGVPTQSCNGMAEHPGFVPGTNNLPLPTSGGYNGQVEVQQQSSPSESNWLYEQSQKLERQQQLQQQKLLELEQTLLRTEILKNRLEIVNNLKHASPELQSQLIGVLSSRPSPVGASTTSAPHVSLATPASVVPRLVSRPDPTQIQIPRSAPSLVTTPSLPSPPDSELDEFPEGGKKKSHNLIEKKYRTSINDRIGTLRNIVSKHFKGDKKMQKSAVLQKTIDYIRYLENVNQRVLEENRQLKGILTQQGYNVTAAAGAPVDSTGKRCSSATAPRSNGSPLSWSDLSDEHPSSPDVFLSDTSPGGSPPLALPSAYHNGGTSAFKLGGQVFMCLMLVMCFFVDPLSLMGGQGGPAGVTHGSQRTLNSLDGFDDDDGIFSLGWFLMWGLRLLVAGLCFGFMWIYSLPAHNPEWEGMRFWRLRKQAEKDIKKGDFSSAQVHLVSALTEIGLPLPTSYSSLVFSLFWNGLSHVLFQLYIGQLMVTIVSFLARRGRKGRTTSSDSQKSPQTVGYADVAKTKHLLHQISLAGYDERTMHGLGFYLGLTALNYGEVERNDFTRDQWAELLFTLGIQCQFSCACIASLLAHYYFMCAGNLGGLLSFVNTTDGWDFLMSKEWTSDVQNASKLYKGVAVFPKYSVVRSYCKALLTEAYRDLLLPNDSSLPLSTSVLSSRVNLEECVKVFKQVLAMTRQANGYLVEDMKVLSQTLPSLSDTVITRDCGFEVLMWWASVGLVASHWTREDNSEKGEEEIEEYFPIIEDLSEESGPIPSALHLAFKVQRLHRHSSSSAPPPLSVINQLCSTASHALKICDQNMSSEDTLHLMGLLLACNWLLSLRYSVWKEQEEESSAAAAPGGGDDSKTLKHIVKGYQQDIDVLSQLTSHLPGAFPQLRRYKGYQRLISGGNPILADSFLGVGVGDQFRRRQVLSS